MISLCKNFQDIYIYFINYLECNICFVIRHYYFNINILVINVLLIEE